MTALFDKQQLAIYAVVAVLAGGTGTGGATLYSQQHTHPLLVAEIRRVQYEGEIFKLSVTVDAMQEAGEEGTADYTVAVTMLAKFTNMLAELDK